MSESTTTASIPHANTDSLVRNLAQRLGAAVLPGDGGPSPEALEAAARFLFDAAARRGANETALGIETVSGAAGERFMRIAVVNEDMPFLVDSIAATVATHGLVIDRLLHPVLPVVRDGVGTITALPAGEAPGTPRESMVYIETPRADARTRAALLAALQATLADVRAAVSDWPAMQAAMGTDAGRLTTMDRAEGAALLRWLKDGMLTLLGHETRDRDGAVKVALGICRSDSSGLLDKDTLARALAWSDAFAHSGGSGRLPLIIKSDRLARVHRQVPLDLFIVPVIEAGAVVALSIHAGVWTSAALACPPQAVPRMRTQLASLFDKFGFNPNGHAGKALVHALTSLPHDQLIAFEDADLERVAIAMMTLIDRPRPRLALVRAALEEQLFAFVWLPRETLSNEVRDEIFALLTQACGGELLDWSLEIDGRNLAQLRIVLAIGKRGAPLPDEAELDTRLQAMLRGWVDAVEAEIAEGPDAGRAAAIAARYAPAFPPAYRTLYGPREAAIDTARLRHLSATALTHPDLRAVRLYRLPDEDAGRLRLKLYQRHGGLELSGTVPALENFGFRVIDTIPTELGTGEPDGLGTIHDFLLALPHGHDADPVIEHAPAIEQALGAVLNGAGEDDAFNRLIVGVGLSAREATWLRAWYRYLRQAGMNFSIPTVVDALMSAPMVTLGLIDLFRARHQPDLAQDRAEAEAEAQEVIRNGLAGVTAINDDRLLRAFRALVLAILRSNAFAPAGEDTAETALAFKLDSAAVPGLPRPLPWREIFVYSRRVEGVHLRSGPVARGGIRWSDRRDDFRTEILGLMKAQRVKNAVIVPTGAKGGFYPKQLPDPARDREGWAAEGRASYIVFIRALLSITDNIVDGAVAHPAGVIIRDGEDPYFVVAADKGTATYSDTANGLAAEHDFWLDDAFASGGSKGYDHKAMGITARGAWLSVQRHFRELGVDVQADPVRVVGVGDMSGDVFGNGMLLSKSLKLVAAFDHRHIFLDPEPDAALSWAERNRLFALPRSSWDDYDRSLLSPGGGIYPRSLKEIPLSVEARAALGITAETVEPDTLISAILAAPVDMLWFGGIGTYVKATSEANADVGDPANDAIRINARAVRARVIGEGANLGCTQGGRIEFALAGHDGKGGRNNTDFIDNSAGVDCSDKEVNIKIALASAKRAGRLDEDARVALLVAMTEDVAALVLEDNRLQALGLSIAESAGAAGTGSYLRLMDELEAGNHLDRKTEGLADTETFVRRAGEGRGFTRPELAVLLSSAKLVLQDALERSAVPDDEGLEGELLSAFPPAMQEQMREDILAHRLRREIIATRLSNRLVNRLGFTLPFEMAEEEGVSLAEVTAAFLAAERLFDLPALWQRLEAAAMPETARIRLLARAAEAVRGHMADLLRAGATRMVPGALAGQLAGGVDALTARLGDLLAAEASAASARIREDFLTAGAGPEDAALVARLFELDGAVGIARLAHDSGTDAVALAHAFSTLGARMGLDWAQATAARLTPADPWERMLVGGLARDFQQMRLDFLRRVVVDTDPMTAALGWMSAQDGAINRFRAMVVRAQTAPLPGAAMLAQIASQARNVLAR